MLCHGRRLVARPAAAAARRAQATKSGTWMDGPRALATDLVHAAVEPEPLSGAVLTPLFLSTTFVQDSVEQYLAKGYSYSRTNNPTVTALETKLAALENGYGAAAFGTGMAWEPVSPHSVTRGQSWS